MFRLKEIIRILTVFALTPFMLTVTQIGSAAETIAEETAAPQTSVPLTVPFYVGTYTQGNAQGKGIYLSALNTQDGSFVAAELLIECDAPAFLVRHPSKPTLYAVAETWNGEQGTVYAFAVDKSTNRLTRLPDQKVPGVGTTHLCVHCDALGDTLVVVNYGGGNVVSLPINENGELGSFASSIQHYGSGPNPSRQKEPHPHGVYIVPFSNQILVPDLGIDKLMMYKVDSNTAKITPDTQIFLEMPPGSGPRHLAFAFGADIGNPPGTPYIAAKSLYVVNELDSTVSFVIQKNVPPQNGVPQGENQPSNNTLRWEIAQTVSTLPKSVLDSPEQLQALKNTTAEIAVHPSGRFVYASNRGHDSIAVFSVDKATGNLTLLQTEPTQGKNPRHFAISSCGHFLLAANQDSHTIFSFRIDQESGKLAPTGKSVNVGSPVCVVF